MSECPQCGYPAPCGRCDYAERRELELSAAADEAYRRRRRRGRDRAEYERLRARDAEAAAWWPPSIFDPDWRPTSPRRETDP